ncbi:MAG: Ig-like domain-containing protein [Thermoanaerobaculia bacterium]
MSGKRRGLWLLGLWMLGGLAAAAQEPEPPPDPTPAAEDLVVTSPQPRLQVGQSLQLTVIAPDVGSGPRNVTADPFTVYESSNSTILTVSPTGLVTGTGPGHVTVVVFYGDPAQSTTSTDYHLGRLDLVVGTPADRDGDGLPDSYETTYGFDPNTPGDQFVDTDGDALTNAQEFALGTNPLKADTDGDTLADGQEIARGLNPLVPDFDPGPRLDENCIATILNRRVQVAANGTFTLGNVPVPMGAFRVRIVCNRDGRVEQARSGFVLGQVNSTTDIGPIIFGEDDQLPVTLRLSSPTAVLNPATPTAQLTTTGILVDSTQTDVTPSASGTFYTTSNPAIASVDSDGLVSARSSGTFLVTANHEGVVASLQLAVSLTTDSDGDGLPDDFENANRVNPGGSNFARIPGVVVNVSSSSPSFPASRAVDGDPQTSWFTAVGDAANRRTSPFIEVVLPSAQSVAQIRLLGNRQNADGFDFFAGIFQAFDDSGAEIFNSGELLLPAPSRDIAVPVDLDNVRRVRFTATADESNTPGLSEIQVISRPGGAALDPANGADGAADFDFDGLTNLREFQLGTSIFSNDTDSDGLLDPQELALGSNPLLADTDNDGLLDGSEPSPTSDFDGDGLINLLDPDSDNDGLPDGLEVRLGLSPLATDTNRNGIADGSEDSDADGLPNGEEVLENTDATNPDTDGDGLRDGEEVIAGTDGFITDPLRADTDRDGMPDGYESRFGLNPTDPTDAGLDPDGDGLTNLQESQLGTDPHNADIAPPAVAQITPADGATNVATNSVIVVRFTEPLQASSVVAGVVAVTRAGANVPGSVALSGDRLSITFTPTGGNFEGTSLHNVQVANVRDAAGNLLPAPFLSSFTTGVLVDTVRPTVVTTSPVSGQTGVPVNSPFTVQFSERMDPATLIPANWTVRENVNFTNLAGMIQVDPDGRRASFVPNQPLPVGRSHSVFLSTTGIKDLAGNPLTGTSGFSFTTAFFPDNARPLVVATSPTEGASNVAVNALVYVQLSEPVEPISVARGIRLFAGGNLVVGSYALSDGNRRVTFTSAAALPSSSALSLVISTELTDLAGNPVDNPRTVNFTTTNVGDLTRPSVSVVQPANGATGVATDAVIQISFSEPVAALTVSLSSFQLSHNATGALIPGSVTVAPDARSARFVPAGELEASTVYRLQASSEITDVAGQQLNFFASTFTTAAGTDTVAPTVETLAPGNGALNVPVNARVAVRVSEPIDPLSVGSGAIVLTQGGNAVAGAVALSSDRMGLTFTPTAALATATVYQVTVGNFTDRSGNLVVPAFSSFTTSASAGADTTRPAVSAISPANNATNVDTSSTIVWTFNEPIDPGTVGLASMPVTIDNFSGQVPGSYAVLGNQVSFTPLSALPANVRVRPNVNFDQVRDLAGNGSNSFSSSFVTGAGADTTAPQIQLVTPSDGATDVGPNAQVVLTFSEPLDPNTVGGGSFDLFVNGDRLNTSVSRSADNRTVILTTTLPAASTVTVVATNDVKDLSGNTLADFSSTFTTASSFDNGRPSVVSQRPANGASGVPANTSLVLYVNEALDEATLPGALFVARDGVLVSGTVAVTGSGRAIEFVPDAPFPASALVQIFLTPDARDLAGNSVNNYEASFRVAGTTTGVRPSVVRTSPANSVTGVPNNAVVELEWSEPLNAATVNGTTVTLRQNAGAGPVVPSTVSLVRGGRVVRIVPQAALIDGQQYFVQVTTGLLDLDGQGLSSTQNFIFFRSGPAPDATAPAADTLSPPDGEINVGLNGRVRVRFSEAVNPLTISGNSIAISSGGPAVVPSTITFANGDREVLIVPHAPLAASTLYRVHVEGVEDLAGNPVAVREVSFTTGSGPDTVAPQVVRNNPVSSQVDVPVNSTVTLDLSEPIDAISVTASTFQVRENTNFTNLTGSYTVSTDGRRLDFVPAAPLPAGRSHSVFFSSQGIEDYAGNRLTGSNFSFTASFTPDTTPPSVVEIGPRDGSTVVPTNGRVLVRFNEPIAATSFDAVQLRRGATPVAVRRLLSDGNRLLTLVPTSLLAANTAYEVLVGAVRDLAGNSLPAPVSTTFNTETGADLVRPSVVSVDPVNGATGVGTANSIFVQFSERIHANSVTSSSFQVTLNATGALLSGTLTVPGDGRSVRWTPVVPLPASTLLRVQVSSEVLDLAGQQLNFFASTFTTGVGVDNSVPLILSVSPPDGASNTPVNTRVVVRLSEPAGLSSVGPSSIQVRNGASPVAGTVTLSSDRQTLFWTPAGSLPTSTLLNVDIGGFTDRAGNPVTGASSSFTTGAAATPDTTRPSVASIVPANNATGVAVGTTIVWTFNEPIDPTSVDVSTLPVTVDGFSGQVAGSFSVAGAVVTFTPNAPLPGNVRVRPNANFDQVKDLAGNGTNSFSSSFVTQAVADTTPPTVLLVTPANGGTDAGPNTVVVLTFSEPLDASTVSGSTFALLVDGDPLSTSVSRSADNQTVTLTAALPPAATVTVVATNDVKDLSGNRLADFQSQFQTAPSFDSGRPSVVSQRPGNGATGVPRSTSVVLYTSEAMDAASIAPALVISVNGVPVAGSVALTGNGRAIEFTPAAPLAYSSLVEIFLSPSARDIAGNAVNSYQASMRIEANPAATAPSVVRTHPTNSAADAPALPVVELEWSEPLDPATVNGTTVTLRLNSGSGPVVASTISLVRGGKVVRIVPTAALTAGQQYFVQVTTGLKDLDGQGLASTQNFIFFRPVATADTVAPTVLAISPPEGEAGVGINARVRVRFDEAVNPLTVTGQSVLLSTGGNPALPCTISFSNGDRDVLIVPHAPLAESTLYTIRVEGVEDRAGNPVGVASASFTTGTEPDTVAPQVTRTNPFSSATNVPVNSIIRLESNEPIDPITVSSSSFQVRENTGFTNLTGTYSVVGSGRRLEFVPSVPLPVSRSHSVFFSSQGIEDLAGNRLTGSNFSFTTSATADATPPVLLDFTPRDGWSTVATNARIYLRFDEPLASLSIDAVTLSGPSGNVAVKRLLSDANRFLVLVPLRPLAPNATYTLSVGAVEDLAGNAFAVSVSASFTTELGADLVRPSVASVVPPSNSTGVSRTVPVVFTFNERIATATLTSASFLVFVNNTGVAAAGTITFSADGLSATFTPSTPLAASTLYRARATSEVLDLAGQQLNFFDSLFTTGP